MTMPAAARLPMFRALAPMFRAPGTTQVIDSYGSVTGVTGVPGFSRTRMGARAGTHPCACLRAITRARPPRHTHHTRHKMSKNKDLGCSGYLEHGDKARNTAEIAAVGADSDRENLAAFARRLGVNRSTVTRAAQAGRLVLDAEGRVCIAASLARYHGTRGGRDDVAQRHAEARGHAVAGVASGATWPADARIGPQQGDQAGGEGDAPAAGSRAAWEALKVRWQNAELLLALDLESGARIPRQTVLHEAQGLGALLRATVERLIDQTAPRLAAAGNAADRRRLLSAELASARRALRREFRAAARRLAPDGTAVRLVPTTDAQEAA